MKLLYIASAVTLAVAVTCDNPSYDSPCPDATCVDGVCTDACANACGPNTMCDDASSTCVADCAPPPRSQCCSVSSSPKCGGYGADDGIASCVCAFDEFCCQSKWDDQCVSEAEDNCGLECTREEDLLASIVRALKEGGDTMVSPVFFRSINTLLLSSGVEPVVLFDARPMPNPPVPATGQPKDLQDVAQALRAAVVAQLSANYPKRRQERGSYSPISADIAGCASNFGTRPGTPVCCGQQGNVKDNQYACPGMVSSCFSYEKVPVSYICPVVNPICFDYEYNVHWGICGADQLYKDCTNFVGPSALSDGNYIDNVEWPIYYPTKEKCAEACEQISACNGLHYYQQGDSGGARGDCYLKTGVTSITFPSTTHAGRNLISSICTYNRNPVTLGAPTPGSGVALHSKFMNALGTFILTWGWYGDQIGPGFKNCLTEILFMVENYRANGHETNLKEMVLSVIQNTVPRICTGEVCA